MEPLALTGNVKLVVAIIMGMGLGFMLVKSELAWRETCLDAILLKNSKVLKTILFSICIGTILFYFAKEGGLVKANIRPSYFWPSLLGGIICGWGISLCCNVPITAIASLAAGRLYAFWVLLGMLLAYPVTTLLNNILSNTLYKWSEPLKYHEHVGSYFDLNNVSLWVAGVCLLLVFILHFGLGGDADEK